MIGKVARFGSSFLGAIQYCYYETRANRSLDRTRIRGELLFAQHLGVSIITDNQLRQESKQRLNIEQMANTMKLVAALNDRISKPVWHQSFSFPIGECPSPDIMVCICQSFARTFGMEQNPLVGIVNTNTFTSSPAGLTLKAAIRPKPVSTFERWAASAGRWKCVSV